MRIQVNQYLRKVPKGFTSDETFKYLCVCSNCKSEMYAEWQNLQYFQFKEKFGTKYIIIGMPPIFSANWWIEEEAVYGRYEWFKQRDADGYFLWEAGNVPAEQVPELLQDFKAGIKELELAYEEMEQFAYLKECPVCHGELAFPFKSKYRFRFDFGFDSFNHNFENCLTQSEFTERERQAAAEQDSRMNKWYFQSGDELADMYRLFNYCIEKKYILKGREKSEELYNHINEAAFSPRGNAEGIKDTPEKLKEFILNLFTLESNIYALGKRLSELYAQQYDSGAKVLQRKFAIEQEIRQQFSELETTYKNKADALDALHNADPEQVCRSKFSKPFAPREPELQKPGLFNKKKVLAENEELTANYRLACEEYKLALEQYKRDVGEYYAKTLADAEQEVEKARIQMEQGNGEIDARIQAACDLPTAEMAYKQIIDDEIAQAENTLKGMIECRNKLYAKDIVFIKYRNMVALATFYEYLMAGRCSSLEGADGAYNIYEAECRANQIIGQLAQVVDSLEEIKESQYLIYSQLQNVNSSLGRLNSTMDGVAKSLKDIKTDVHNISGNSSVIAHNSAVTAYYAKMNAELTNSLGYLVALK